MIMGGGNTERGGAKNKSRSKENKIDSKTDQYWKESQESPIEQEQKKKLEKI